MHEDIGRPEAVLDVRATRVSGKGWPLAGVDVTLTYVVKDRDTRWIDRLITVHGVDDDQRAMLAEIAEKTPVTRAVRAGTEIRTTTGIR
jgi:putative redox protein